MKGDTNMENQHRLPLGLCKQAFMKLESYMGDLHEIREDEDLTPEEKHEFGQMLEVAELLGLRLLNIVKKECGEEEFLNEDVGIDSIDLFPETVLGDILDEEM
jgi:hypothetical protein